MRLAAFVVLFVSWPWAHKKPEPHVQPVDIGAVAKIVQELADIRQDYPWLRPWAEPSLVTVNRLLNGDDQDVDGDMEQLHHDLKALEAMEDNDTI